MNPQSVAAMCDELAFITKGAGMQRLKRVTEAMSKRIAKGAKPEELGGLGQAWGTAKAKMHRSKSFQRALRKKKALGLTGKTRESVAKAMKAKK